eukprot:gene16956-23283_t
MELPETKLCSQNHFVGVASTNCFSMTFNESPTIKDREAAANFADVARYYAQFREEQSKSATPGVFDISPQNQIMKLSYKPTTVADLRAAIRFYRSIKPQVSNIVPPTSSSGSSSSGSSSSSVPSYATLALLQIDEINRQDESGNTSLHYASFNRDVLTATVLIREGIDVNVANKIGFTALHHATGEHVDKRIVNLILDAKGDINARAKSGLTPLIGAVFWTMNERALSMSTSEQFQERLEVIDLLLTRGADPTIVAWDGTSIIDAAPRHPQLKEILKKHGYSCDMYKGFGLWIVCSFLNHDYRPNTAKQMIGRMLFVYANQDMKKGTELTTEYGTGEMLRSYGIS